MSDDPADERERVVREQGVRGDEGPHELPLVRLQGLVVVARGDRAQPGAEVEVRPTALPLERPPERALAGAGRTEQEECRRGRVAHRSTIDRPAGTRNGPALPSVVYDPCVAYVYILRCRDGSLYTGATTDLARRLRQHGDGEASRYTRSRLPVRLVWKRRVASWPAALREERRIKSLPRPAKLLLVGRSGAASPERAVLSLSAGSGLQAGKKGRK